jgi:hypothetical protein
MKKIICDKKYDVIVAGGGTAGFIAAVAAARTGAKTLVIERFNHLCGTAVYGLPFLGIVSGSGEIVNQGLVGELHDRLIKASGSNGIQRGTYWNTPENPDSYEFGLTPFDPEKLKYVAQEMITEAGGEILFYSMVTDVIMDGNKVTAVKVVNKSGEVTISADVFIDATGDADLVYCANGGFIKKDRLQNCSIISRIGNVDLKEFEKEMSTGENIEGKGKWHTRILRGKTDGGSEHLVHMAGHLKPFDDKDKRLTFTAVSNRDGEIFLNATRTTGLDGTDIWDISKGEILERQHTMELFDALKKNVRGFEDAVLLYTSPLGVRETRNIVGEYIITEDDVKEAFNFKDSVANGAYPIDIHDPKGGSTQFTFIKKGGHYNVPYRAMLPKGIEGVIVAGRCISATQKAQGGIRIMGCVMSQGEAAGTAAGLCVKSKLTPKQLDSDELRKNLVKNGALI